MQEEDDNHQGDHDPFLDQACLQSVYGAVDQAASVVDRFDLDPLRDRRRLHLRDFGFDPLDDIEGVFAVAHDNDAAHGLADAIELTHAAADIRAVADLGDAAE